ncbi:hypothetical protein M6B38_316540 [Iris pallida]|uniref:Uncharacterized protein n=1 Tax=Iris pallida TaxID=29817 RepID=A0AAX6HEP4_IRIPA|nr:hypothetical protein M6B38_316540 [Iris pallida]
MFVASKVFYPCFLYRQEETEQIASEVAKLSKKASTIWSSGSISCSIPNVTRRGYIELLPSSIAHIYLSFISIWEKSLCPRYVLY